MTDSGSIGDPGDVEAEASQWLIRLDDEGATAKTRAEFDAWLARDPMHRRAYERLSRTWDRLDALQHLTDTTVTQAPKTSLPRRPVRILAGLGGAAVLFFVAVIGWTVLSSEQAGLSYETAVGERRSIVLVDGSRVELNTASALEVEFTKSERRLRLLRGEGHFRVEPQPGRPFVVGTISGVVRAVGTAFNIRLYDKGADVLVTEGEVEIAAFEHSAPLPVTSGSRAHLAGEAAPLIVEAETMERALAWRNGELFFNGESLEEVVTELHRYTDIKIVLADNDIKHLKVGGRFRLGDVDAILDLIAAGFDLEVESKGDDLRILRRARAS